MVRQRSRDTRPELAVRSALHRQGLRFRVHYRPTPGLRRTSDIAFTRAHVAVLIDGCFWHSCPLHGTTPVANREWWQAKLAATVRRDRETQSMWEAEGWTVLRFWEHESPELVASAIRAAVEQAQDPRSRKNLHAPVRQRGR